MNLEIEKKYLISQKDEFYATSGLRTYFTSYEDLKDTVMRKGVKIRQGYLPVSIGKEIAGMIGVDVSFEPSEARLRDQGGKYILTLKSSGGLERYETPDAEISSTIFESYWPYASNKIEKVRMKIHHEGHIAEIDVYMDRDLIIAEVEVQTKEIANRISPLGIDITEDLNYKNHALAKSDFQRTFVLTGGPCCGKTITLEYLSSLKYPTVDEAARQIIEEQNAIKGDLVPWKNLQEFQLEVLRRHAYLEESVQGLGTVFLDRGAMDGMAYCKSKGIEPPKALKDVKRDYKAIFVLDPVPYMQDGERTENENQAKKLHGFLIELYESLGFSTISVPVNLNLSLEESVKERAHFIVNRSQSL